MLNKQVRGKIIKKKEMRKDAESSVFVFNRIIKGYELRPDCCVLNERTHRRTGFRKGVSLWKYI